MGGGGNGSVRRGRRSGEGNVGGDFLFSRTEVRVGLREEDKLGEIALGEGWAFTGARTAGEKWGSRGVRWEEGKGGEGRAGEGNRGEFVGEAGRWSEARRRRRARGGGGRRRMASRRELEMELEEMAARRSGGGGGLRTAASR